ncbi:MAG TPA: protein translocase subunit SecD [Balneolaceae bacterium]|nr:protein translocase subunit SecD [Balneolaceae bacterium]
MKKNGTKIAFIVVFIGITIYYLWPTVSFWLQKRYINGLPKAEQATYRKNHAQKMKRLRKNSLSLGLDLQGGMHVTLQVGTPKLIRELAGQYEDSTLDSVVHDAHQIAEKNNSDFINEFMQIFNQRYPNGRLSRYFRSQSENITRRSSNAQIEQYLKKQRKQAVGRALQIIRRRIDRYGVTQPSIERLGSSRISVELPGVADKQRVRKLLKGTARLQFRLAANPQQLNSAKRRIVQYYNKQASDTTDTTADSLSQAQASANNPLLQVLHSFGGRGQSRYVFGYAAANDTARVDDLLRKSAVQKLMPRNVQLMWGAQPFQKNQNGVGLFRLIGVRKQVELTGNVIEDASVNFSKATNQPKVSMTMNSEGARKWARITGANIGKPVAIILDGYVYSYPVVQTKISSGRSSITGLKNVGEAKDLVNILLSGALPAPLKIVEQRTVGATLGEASIHSGFYSILFAFIVVVAFMVLYYHTGGAIADLALILNLFFILGILAAFHATLTLPGMAGIVLTIGMAVDANVLIFDRIREELRFGKTFNAAIDSGYKNAMSAIIDGNVTTFFVGIILYSFGMGPIKGFAVTLMAGIVSSLFSAIIITRVVVDYLTRDKTKTFSFG